MTPFGVSIEKAKELRKAMQRMKIYEKDIKEVFIRSSGPGGQNVNKVSTCVVVHHLPTGILVRSQQERSQGLNRYAARRRLIAKIEQKKKSAKQKAIADREKRKRQNRKRSKASKTRMLDEKRQHGQKKVLRRRVNNQRLEDY